MKLTSKIAVTLAVLALASTAHAQKLVGKVDFTGTAVLNGTLASATQVTSWGGLTASQATGSFAPIITLAESQAMGFIPPPSTVTIFSPWTFNSGAVTPLWSVAAPGGQVFSFDLTSSTKNIGSNPTFLDVSGTGFMYTNNVGGTFERTFGTWTFNITNASNTNSAFSFQSSTASVPDGGATLALLGMSFLGLGGVSRLVRRK